jgi:Flp pilus assembly protein TadB
MLRPEPGEQRTRPASAGRAVARLGIPTLIAAAGLVLIAVGEAALGATLLGISLLVVGANWLARLSLRSQLDRDREEAARRQFSRTGRWPDR